MIKLAAKNPCDGLLPTTVGEFVLSEVVPENITSVAVQKGKERQASKSLKDLHGMAFPSANRATGIEAARCIWSGPGQAFLVGPKPKAVKGVSITDQSDAWAVLRLHGPDADAALARLVPIDLRPSVFKRGHTVRTMLNHMSASITRTSANSFDIMVFRSMAKTAVEELTVAMKSVAAQNQAD